jgi:hypothetical protein
VLIDIEAYRRLRFRAAARREALRLALRRGAKTWYKRLFSGGA